MKHPLAALSRFLKNQRGQTSIEIAMITGAIFIMSVTTFPYLVEANTLNKGVASARDGATYAQAMINMGYTNNDFFGATLPQGERVHVDRVGYTVEKDYMPGIDKVSIILTISGTTDNNIAQQVQNQAGDFIYFNFNGAWPSTSTLGVVEIEGYQFMVSYELV